MKKIISVNIFLVLLVLVFSAPALYAQTVKSGVWEKELSAGYNQATGNTQSAQLTASLEAIRKKDDDELTVKAKTLYSSQNKKMDGQKHEGSMRYAFNFWEKEWYAFYKFAAEHDKFANINSRLIPSSGIGYWLSDTTDWKLLAEIGLGLEHTSYSDTTKDTTDAILIPRMFFEKAVFDEATISQDLILYPNLEGSGQYRIYGETRFTNPLSESMSLRFSFIDEFQSKVAGNIKKNDTRTVLSLVYSF